jgi:predicted amidohydrolase
MKIALCQTQIYDTLEKNLEEICSILRSLSADLYLFPELALTGYGEKLRELVESEEYFNALQVLKEYAKDKNFLLGAPYLREEKLYNSALLFRDGDFRAVAERLPSFQTLMIPQGLAKG